MTWARQILRFLAVGGGATIIHVAAAMAFHHTLGLTPGWANALAFAVALGASYAGNWAWTFEARARHGFAVPRFLIVAGLGFLLNQAIVLAGTSVLQLPLWTCLAAVILVVPAFTFWLQKTRVFAAIRADA